MTAYFSQVFMEIFQHVYLAPTCLDIMCILFLPQSPLTFPLSTGGSLI